jgi:hypothetical protein
MKTQDACNTKKPKHFIDIGVRVRSLGRPTTDFELVKLGGSGDITPGPNGPGQFIDLSGIHGKVTMNFRLEDGLDLRFKADPYECMGIRHAEHGCPDTAVNDHKRMFKRVSVSDDQKTLTVKNFNIGGRIYRFALFMVDRHDNIVAHCDPRIINR